MLYGLPFCLQRKNATKCLKWGGGGTIEREKMPWVNLYSDAEQFTFILKKKYYNNSK